MVHNIENSDRLKLWPPKACHHHFQSHLSNHLPIYAFEVPNTWALGRYLARLGRFLQRLPKSLSRWKPSAEKSYLRWVSAVVVLLVVVERSRPVNGTADFDRLCRFFCLFSGAYREKNWGSSGKHWQSYRHPNRDSTRRKLALGEASELWLKLKLSKE